MNIVFFQRWQLKHHYSTISKEIWLFTPSLSSSSVIQKNSSTQFFFCTLQRVFVVSFYIAVFCSIGLFLVNAVASFVTLNPVFKNLIASFGFPVRRVSIWIKVALSFFDDFAVFDVGNHSDFYAVSFDIFNDSFPSLHDGFVAVFFDCYSYRNLISLWIISSLINISVFWHIQTL